MNFKNKFDETTKKYYLITTSCGHYLTIYNGSKSDYFKKHSGVQLIIYAGKAVSTISLMLDKSRVALTAYKKDENKPSRNDLMLTYYSNRITQCENAINELKTYQHYDLVGVCVDVIHETMFSEEPTAFRIFDYKTAGAIVAETHELRFTEITRQQYEAFHAKQVLINHQDLRVTAKQSAIFTLSVGAIISVITALFVYQKNPFTTSSLIMWIGVHIVIFGACYAERNTKMLSFRNIKLYLYSGFLMIASSFICGFIIDAYW